MDTLELHIQRQYMLAAKDDLVSAENSLIYQIKQFEKCLIKHLYFNAIVQFLATIGSLLAFMKFMM